MMALEDIVHERVEFIQQKNKTRHDGKVASSTIPVIIKGRDWRLAYSFKDRHQHQSCLERSQLSGSYQSLRMFKEKVVVYLQFFKLDSVNSQKTISSCSYFSAAQESTAPSGDKNQQHTLKRIVKKTSKLLKRKQMSKVSKPVDSASLPLGSTQSKGGQEIGQNTESNGSESVEVCEGQEYSSLILDSKMRLVHAREILNNMSTEQSPTGSQGMSENVKRESQECDSPSNSGHVGTKQSGSNIICRNINENAKESRCTKQTGSNIICRNVNENAKESRCTKQTGLNIICRNVNENAKESRCTKQTGSNIVCRNVNENAQEAQCPLPSNSGNGNTGVNGQFSSVCKEDTSCGKTATDIIIKNEYFKDPDAAAVKSSRYSPNVLYVKQFQEGTRSRTSGLVHGMSSDVEALRTPEREEERESTDSLELEYYNPSSPVFDSVSPADNCDINGDNEIVDVDTQVGGTSRQTAVETYRVIDHVVAVTTDLAPSGVDADCSSSADSERQNKELLSNQSRDHISCSGKKTAKKTEERRTSQRVRQRARTHKLAMIAKEMNFELNNDPVAARVTDSETGAPCTVYSVTSDTASNENMPSLSDRNSARNGSRRINNSDKEFKEGDSVFNGKMFSPSPDTLCNPINCDTSSALDCSSSEDLKSGLVSIAPRKCLLPPSAKKRKGTYLHRVGNKKLKLQNSCSKRGKKALITEDLDSESPCKPKYYRRAKLRNQWKKLYSLLDSDDEDDPFVFESDKNHNTELSKEQTSRSEYPEDSSSFVSRFFTKRGKKSTATSEQRDLRISVSSRADTVSNLGDTHVDVSGTTSQDDQLSHPSFITVHDGLHGNQAVDQKKCVLPLKKKSLPNSRRLSSLEDIHILSVLRSNEDYLRDIFKGKISCRRHDEYKKGGTSRMGLNFQVPMGLISEEQEEVIMDTLMEMFCSKHSKYLDYVLKVLFPEVLVRLYMELNQTTHSEAEDAMQPPPPDLGSCLSSN